VKVAISFLAGVIICGLMLVGVRSVLPTSADTVATEGTTESGSLIRLIPDIEKIYRQSLITPFLKAEEQIYDDDIRAFYRELLEATGLTEENLEPQPRQ